MVKTTRKNTLNDFDSGSSELDSLFADARSSESDLGLYDQNLSKVVVNSLPTRVSRNNKGSHMFDMLGVLIGAIMAFFFFDLNQSIINVLSVVPESISLTVANLVTMILSASVLAWLGWWTAERVIR